jgi:putative redox protein
MGSQLGAARSPSSSNSMVKITFTYQGDLRCEAVHAPSQVRLATDAPVDNQGRGESFSPTDLVATALGACMLTTMGIVAARHGWDLRGSSAEVEKLMVSQPVRRIGELTVVLHMAGQHDERARTTLERAALTCPVHRSLAPDVAIPVRIEWAAPKS